jgi:hypothetical protein
MLTTYLKIHKNKLLTICLSTFLFGCTNQGDWPELTSDVPDAKERERVIERLNPSSYVQPVAISGILSEGEANTVLQEVITTTKSEKQMYLQDKAIYTAIEIATESGLKLDAWFGLQLALTRLSHTGSRLDTLINIKNFPFADVQIHAKQLKVKLDEFVIRERQALVEIKPK